METPGRRADKAKTIKHAGSFSTDYVVKKGKKQIEETYKGKLVYRQFKNILYEYQTRI